MGMDFRGLVLNRVWKITLAYIFWSEIGSGFEEPGGTPPPRISRSNSPGRVTFREHFVSSLLYFDPTAFWRLE